MSNKLTREMIEEEIAQWAREEAHGGEAWTKTLMRATEGAFHGALNDTRDKDGEDDAIKLARLHIEHRQKGVVFNAKIRKQQVTVSAIRKMIQVGMLSGLGMGEPLQARDDMMAKRRAILAKPNGNKLVNDAPNTLLKWAREQLRHDHLLTDEQVEAIVRKPVSATPTVIDVLASCRKTLQQLEKGKAANGALKDNSEEVKDAIRSLSQRIAALAQGAKDHDDRAPDVAGSPTCDMDAEASADIMRARFAAAEEEEQV